MLWLDEYERAARLAPGLLASLPLPILIVVFGVRHNPVVAAGISLVVAAGGPLVLAKYVRTRGRALEARLNEEWGGPPTTLLLLPANDNDPVRRQRRSSIEAVSGVALPKMHTIEAGRICEAAVTTLRQRTYGHGTYPLVFAENKSYGFERNTLAVRREALWLCAAGLIIAATGLAVAASHHLHVSATAMGIGCVANLALLTFWTVWPTSERVRNAGDLYAAQLLDAAATLTT